MINTADAVREVHAKLNCWRGALCYCLFHLFSASVCAHITARCVDKEEETVLLDQQILAIGCNGAQRCSHSARPSAERGCPSSFASTRRVHYNRWRRSSFSST